MSGETSDPEASAARPFPGDDLALELMREHTLLNVMAARMRETADVLQRGVAVERSRVERALDVHRRFLIEVHHEHERRVDAALSRSTEPEVQARVADCRKEHPRAEAFQTAARAALGTLGTLAPAARQNLASLLRAEAERFEEHHAREDDAYRRIDRWIPAGERTRILAEIRAFDASHVSAEIALISWAAQAHPSAD